MCYGYVSAGQELKALMWGKSHLSQEINFAFHNFGTQDISRLSADCVYDNCRIVTTSQEHLVVHSQQFQQ
jgi:hypothetical protein